VTCGDASGDVPEQRETAADDEDHRGERSDRHPDRPAKQHADPEEEGGAADHQPPQVLVAEPAPENEPAPSAASPKMMNSKPRAIRTEASYVSSPP
jgi:hypothetical protein